MAIWVENKFEDSSLIAKLTSEIYNKRRLGLGPLTAVSRTKFRLVLHTVGRAKSVLIIFS